MDKERLEEIKHDYRNTEFASRFFTSLKNIDWLIENSEKRVKIEVTDLKSGGGNCPSCSVRLIGKANYCGRCGQRVGWKALGGNIYDERRELW